MRGRRSSEVATWMMSTSLLFQLITSIILFQHNPSSSSYAFRLLVPSSRRPVVRQQRSSKASIVLLQQQQEYNGIDNDDDNFEYDEEIKMNGSSNSKETNVNDNDNGGDETEEQPIVRTLGGGSQLIFEMARRMMVWNDDVTSGVETSTTSTTSKAATASSPPRVLPRWHPHPGVSDVNPSFRTSAPIMSNQGYARTIWRNVRKRNKPSLWRHALRTYYRMEAQQKELQSRNSRLQLERSNIHYEGALLACAKLGLWEEALTIYQEVEVQQQEQWEQEQQRRNTAAGTTLSPETVGGSTTGTTIFNGTDASAAVTVTDAAATPTTAAAIEAETSRIRRRKTFVTDNMVYSVLQACVRGSKKKTTDDDTATTAMTVEDRRKPLDAAMTILTTIPSKYRIPVVARYVNPLAAAYQSMGLLTEARNVIEQHLSGRTTGPEAENGADPLNIQDIGAKDKASYGLLVKSALTTRDWANAVDALQDMTEAGLYPTARQLNQWTEVSEKKRTRKTRSWKKKRDEYWYEKVW